MTVKTTADSAATAAGIGDGSSGAVVAPTWEDRTSGADSDDSGSMTIATTGCQRRHGADNRGVASGATGAFTVQRDWRRGGCDFLSVGDGNTGAGGAVTVTASKTTADSAAGRR